MKLKTLTEHFSVCKTKDLSAVDFNAGYFFIGKTDEELSVVTETSKAPKNATHRDDGWRALRVDEKLDFSLVGVLSNLTTCLSQKQIPVFAVSTYDTDYILVKSRRFADAISALKDAGYEIV